MGAALLIAGLALAARALVGAADEQALTAASAGRTAAASDTPGARGETRGIAYADRDGRPLLLDAFVPATGDPPPVVALVHGGGWRSGSRDDWARTARSLVDAGYAAVSVDYRLSGDATFPAPANDVRDAVRFVRRNANALGVDGTRIVVMGGSAGGHLALLVGTSEPGLRGVAALSPPTDLTSLAPGPGETEVPLCGAGGCRVIGLRSLVTDLLGCDPAACPDTARAASPTEHAGPGDPPVLVVHATDEVIPLEQAQLLHRRLRAAGVWSTLVTFPGDRHGGQLLGEAWPSVLEFLASVTALDAQRR